MREINTTCKRAFAASIKRGGFFADPGVVFVENATPVGAIIVAITVVVAAAAAAVVVVAIAIIVAAAAAAAAVLPSSSSWFAPLLSSSCRLRSWLR